MADPIELADSQERPLFRVAAESLVDDVIAHRDDNGHLANTTADELRDTLDVACERLRFKAAELRRLHAENELLLDANRMALVAYEVALADNERLRESCASAIAGALLGVDPMAALESIRLAILDPSSDTDSED